MDKSFNISINLLPKLEANVIAQQKKFKKVQFFGMVVIFLLFFLTLVIFALAIIQNNYLKHSQEKLDSATKLVEQNKGKEVSLLVLKDRLREIGKIKSQPSKQALVLGLIYKLLPSEVAMNSMTITKNSTSDLLITTRDATLLDDFLGDLIDNEKNEKLVKGVTIDNFSRGKEQFYRVALKIE